MTGRSDSFSDFWAFSTETIRKTIRFGMFLAALGVRVRVRVSVRANVGVRVRVRVRISARVRVKGRCWVQVRIGPNLMLDSG